VTYSTIPLALGLGADVFVVGTKIVASEVAAAVAGVAVLALLIAIWHVLPLLRRWRQGSRLDLSKLST
jgi:hypothetical protein